MSRVLPYNAKQWEIPLLLDGRKTVTRRVIKVPPYYPHFHKLHLNTDRAITGSPDRLFAGFYKDEQIFYIDGEKHIDAVYYSAPCKPGDTLYVRETWAINPNPNIYGNYYYKANKNAVAPICTKWHPPIHMPKEAARIWLKVTDVRVERLQDITADQCIKEGTEKEALEVGAEFTRGMFSDIWDGTIKKPDLDRYGWNANPWVWVIKFERCEKPE